MTAYSSSTLQVSELFAGIQGESTRAGMPCGFVRLSGCNLRCAWCDTAYAFGDGTETSLDNIMKAVRGWGIPLVEITGGEPLLQSACAQLAEALVSAGYTTLIETNGTLPINQLPDGVIRIMDIKCPGSGMSEKTHWPNMDALTLKDEVKFVLATRRDYDWSLDVMRRYGLAEKCAAVLLSPVSGLLDAQCLAQWMMQDKPAARLQLQLHKILWPGEMRGV